MTASQLTYLRVKRMTLAAEARIIKAEEYRALTSARKLSYDSNRAHTRERLEAKYVALRQHRRFVVRPAARVAHLANAYLKGMPYAKVEDPRKVKNPVSGTDCVNIAKTVKTFGGATEQDVRPKDIFHWIEGGKTLRQEADATAVAKAEEVAA